MKALVPQLTVLLLAASLTMGLRAAPVPVRYREGELHGFVELQTLTGQNMAYGETIQMVRGDTVTGQLVFRFIDGSLFEETTEFSQTRTFRLIRDHVIQRGPAFKTELDATIDASKGEVRVRSRDKDGKQKEESQHLEIPDDAANGMIFILVKDVPSDAGGTTVSYVATTPKPRLVKIHIIPEGTVPFSVGTLHKQANHFVLKFEIGGIAGVIAPLIGKQPPDINSWTVAGQAPFLVRTEAPLEADGPIWRIQSAPPPIFPNR
ncbi:MAG: hypothetical protein JO323_11670 [Acidobacteriia bacterium]|nr:hypothetical protein [Terriglobia bacterium]